MANTVWIGVPLFAGLGLSMYEGKWEDNQKRNSWAFDFYIDTGNYLLQSEIDISVEDSGNASGYVTIQGSPGGTIIDRQGFGDALSIIANDLRIEGLTIMGARNGIYAKHANADSSIIIANNVFVNCTVGIELSTRGAPGGRIEVINNLFVDNDKGLDFDTPIFGEYVMIRNNTISNTMSTRATGIHFWSNPE